jgi:probable rRNA maturation factor
MEIIVRSTVSLPFSTKKWRKELELFQKAFDLERKKWSLRCGSEAVALSLLVVGKKKMRSINEEQRGKDYATDVLSFPTMADWRLKKGKRESAIELIERKSCLLEHGPNYLGDIVICRDVALAQSQAFHISLADEMVHLLIHGVLHLLGWDHERSAREEKEMETLEHQFLATYSKLRKINKG